MTDIFSAEQRSAIMRRVRSKDTAPELAVRKALFARNYRYRLHRAELPGKPDIVFPGRHKVIFVHGCFWHQHSGCTKATIPDTRSDWWRAKLERTVERDRENCNALELMNWTVTVAWECETHNIDRLMLRLISFLEG